MKVSGYELEALRMARGLFRANGLPCLGDKLRDIANSIENENGEKAKENVKALEEALNILRGGNERARFYYMELRHLPGKIKEAEIITQMELL